MKHIWWYLLLFCLPAVAQQNDEEAEIDYSAVVGNPYLIKDWSNGLVRFTSGRTMNQFKLKFDCLRNRLELQFQGTVFGAESQVKEFIMYTKSGRKKDSLLFRKGYPNVDKNTAGTYYEVLFEGKVELLRLHARDLIEEKEMVRTGKATMRMLEAQHYYLFRNGVLRNLPADKNELPKAFPGKEEIITQFINEQNLKLRDAGDFIRLAKKYNELL